ncbi:MAG: hypothetical protein F4Y27_07875 [Acidimicrobiaceae bacterium]|nr:hypothetical protein [Acidimicrobiaceae bacterium]MYJ97551.1 hypothetical protein [Acidimicrobiaceae bacterium]
MNGSKRSRAKGCLIIFLTATAVLVALSLVLGALGLLDEEEAEQTGTRPATTTATAAAPQTTTTTVSSTNTLDDSFWLNQAVQKAEDYLEFSSFSKQGLIEQLEFEGFTTSDATQAVNGLSVDWTRQAQCKAAEYLDFSSFSKQGLIDQLEFEGFTSSQAQAGAASPLDC